MTANPVAKKAKAKVNQGHPKHLRPPLRKRQGVREKLGGVIPRMPTKNKPCALCRFVKQEHAVKKRRTVAGACFLTLQRRNGRKSKRLLIRKRALD